MRDPRCVISFWSLLIDTARPVDSKIAEYDTLRPIYAYYHSTSFFLTYIRHLEVTGNSTFLSN
jgi:hypothetical protein